MLYAAVFATQYNSSLSSFVSSSRILSQVVAEKYLTEKYVHVYYIGMTEDKIENLKKEGKRRISILIFIYTKHTRCTLDFIILYQAVAEKTLTKMSICVIRSDKKIVNLKKKAK